MSRLPTLKPQKVIRFLQKLGFKKTRQEGSHIFFKHPDGRTTVVPFHAGRDIGRGLLRQILDDIKTTPKELQKIL